MFRKTGIKEAAEIIKWKYHGIYSYYNMEEHEKIYLYTTNYHNSLDDFGVEGFFCTDYEATIDTKCGYKYDNSYIDIAFGLRPDLCGKGIGKEYILKIIEFLNTKHGYKRFRLTVAKFNYRAIKVYEDIGFKVIKEVTSKYDNKKFLIMVFNIY